MVRKLMIAALATAAVSVATIAAASSAAAMRRPAALKASTAGDAPLRPAGMLADIPCRDALRRDVAPIFYLPIVLPVCTH